MHSPINPGWIDFIAAAAPVCLFLGLLAQRIVKAPLVPLKDPRLGESVGHKNYV
jgi:hypothetical protein